MCVVLYELVTGTLPFNGENYNQLLWSIAHNHPVPTTTQFGGDAKLWAILARGFQKQRAGRWESMRDLGEALARWLEDQGVHEDIAGGSLKVAWFDRQNTDSDVFGVEPIVIRRSDPGTRGRPPQRLENGIATLAGHPLEASTGVARAVSRRRWAFALGAVLLLLTFATGFWVARPRPPKATSNPSPNAALRGEPTRSNPVNVNRTSGPTVEPAASSDLEPSGGTVAPPADQEASDARAIASSKSPPTPRPAGRPNSRAQSWEKLKNPFD